jgi:serine phosphatase RsbU (regulator of sigma subunit)
LVDCRNKDGKLFGHEGIENNLRGLRDLSAQEICEKMLERIIEYQGNTEQYDDITIFALQANSN